jgi:hypothetical protein
MKRSVKLLAILSFVVYASVDHAIAADSGSGAFDPCKYVASSKRASATSPCAPATPEAKHSPQLLNLKENFAELEDEDKLLLIATPLFAVLAIPFPQLVPTLLEIDGHLAIGVIANTGKSFLSAPARPAVSGWPAPNVPPPAPNSMPGVAPGLSPAPPSVLPGVLSPPPSASK